MLVQINEYSVINTKNIETIEKSSTTDKWHIHTYNGCKYTLDELYYSIDTLIKHCNGDIE